MTAAGLLKDIYEGTFDDHLDQIIDAARERSRTARKIAAAAIEPGDEIRIVNLSPKYLCNIKGATLIKVTGDKAMIQLPETAKFGRGYGRYYSSDLTTTIPVSCMEAL